MNFGNLARGAVLGLALTGFATAAEATVFRISDMTFSDSEDPGLVVQTNPLDPIQFELNGVGDTEWVSLFEIWSEESAVNLEDDIEPKSFSMELQFDQPPPPFGGSADGETDGGSLGWFIVYFAIPHPTLEWDDNSVVFNFGARGDGKLLLTLDDTSFWWNCKEEWCRKTVKGKFKLLAEATDVPGPGTVALLGVGLLGLGLIGRRRAA